MKFYVRTYGCQMNVADTEVVLSVLDKAGYSPTVNLDDADLAFMNTCAIRENAEEKVRNRLSHWKGLKRRKPEIVMGLLGCMAEHLRKDLLQSKENIIDLVVGPDEYRKLPALVEATPPAGRMGNPPQDRSENHQRKILRRIEDRGSASALIGRKP